MTLDLKTIIKNTIFKIITKPNINLLFRNIYKNIPIKDKSRFPFVGALRYKFDNGLSINMYSDGSDAIVSSLFWDKKYEKSMSDLWLNIIEKDYFIFDIGANTGYYSLISGKLATEGKIFSFEPVPRIQDFFYKNIKLNNLESLVSINKELISDHIGNTDFFVVDSLTLPLGSSENKEFRYGKVPTQTLKLPVNTIDNFVAVNKIYRMDVVKIDTESTEPMVIKGMIESIKKFHPIIICEILSNEVGEKIKNFLEPLGYCFYKILDSGLELEININFEPKAHNHFFIPKERLESLKEKNIL